LGVQDEGERLLSDPIHTRPAHYTFLLSYPQARLTRGLPGNIGQRGLARLDS
jgi:hypothetical protein